LIDRLAQVSRRDESPSRRLVSLCLSGNVQKVNTVILIKILHGPVGHVPTAAKAVCTQKEPPYAKRRIQTRFDKMRVRHTHIAATPRLCATSDFTCPHRCPRHRRHRPRHRPPSCRRSSSHRPPPSSWPSRPRKGPSTSLQSRQPQQRHQ